MTRPWPLRLAAGEGVRAALAGRWLSACVVLLVCWVGAVPGAVDAVTVSRLAAQERDYLAAGGNILIAVNKQSDDVAGAGGISALACDRLALQSGVTASAGLARLDDPATISAAPGADVAVFAATAGIWRLLDVASSRSRDVIVPASLATRLGVVDGSWLRLVAAPATPGTGLPVRPLQVTVAGTEILGEEYTGIMLPLLPGSDAVVDACVVATDPANLATVKGALPAALPAGPDPTVVLDRFIAGRFAADYSAAYRERPLAWAWLGGGVLIGLVWLVLRWVRRSADALYATMGADGAVRLVLRGTEWSVLAIPGALWGISLGMVAAVVADADRGLALVYVTRHVVATLLVATVFVLIGQAYRPKSLLAELKDR